MQRPQFRLLNTFRILTSPREATERWIARYGDPVLVRTINGNVYMTSTPELAKTIFAADPSTFLPFAVRALLPFLGEQSVLLVGGEQHRRDRKLLMPPFHGARMRAYGRVIQDVTRRHLAAACQEGGTRMRDVAQAISLEVIVRTIFGVDDDRVEIMAAAVRELVESAASLLLFVPSLQRSFLGIGPQDTLKRRRERADALLQQQIERARTRDEGEDVLRLMLAARDEDGVGMTDAHIKDELRTLLAAGHETTATALAWAIDVVHRDRALLERLRAEVAREGVELPGSEAGPLLDAVVKETLRRYPIVSEVLRTVAKPFRLGSCDIPVGASVGVSIVGIHHRPDLYPDPDRFDPERFIAKRFGPHEYLPFGGGHRRCIGAAFAEFELRVALATALREFSFTLRQARPPRSVRRNVTLVPQGGVPVSVAHRT